MNENREKKKSLESDPWDIPTWRDLGEEKKDSEDWESMCEIRSESVFSFVFIEDQENKINI